MRQNSGEEMRPDGRQSARAEKTARAKRNQKRKDLLLAVSLMLLIGVAVGGTVAWLVASTTPVENTFQPSTVTCEVQETFSGNVKSDVKVKNTGDTSAYIRVRLITYRQNEDEQTIGGAAPMDPALVPGDNWKLHTDGYYYYTLPVAAGAVTADALIASYTLRAYTDADGGSQVLEILAEAIQGAPASAAGEAWGVTIAPNSVTAYPG